MKSNKRMTSLILILIFIINYQYPAVIGEEQGPIIGGIGMSGSFYTYNNISIPRGGHLSTAEMYIVVYNYIDKPILVNLTSSSPPFIKVVFSINQTNFTLKPGEHKRIQVSLQVLENATPGIYKVSVTAQRIFKEKPGGPVIIQPAATQSINVRIVGEYSIINVYALDPAGKIARNALLRLYRITKTGRIPLVDSHNGELHVKTIPGKYYVEAYLSGELVAGRSFEVAPYENKTINLLLKIVYFEYFSVKPVFTNGKLVAAHLHAIIKNVYKNLNNITIYLIVSYKGKEIDRRVIVKSSMLVLGRNEYEFDYVPSQGWRPGNYTFTMKIYGFGGKLLAQSPTRWMYIKPPQPVWIKYMLYLLIPLIILMIILIMNKRKKKKYKK